MSTTSKKQKKSDTRMVQCSLPVSSLPTASMKAGALRVQEAVREALCNALKRSGLDREYVASELSRLVGGTVNVCTLDSWTAESKSERKLPLEYAGALSKILRDTGILEAALEASGILVLGEREKAIFEIGKLTVEKRKRSKKERALWEQLNGDD